MATRKVLATFFIRPPPELLPVLGPFVLATYYNCNSVIIFLNFYCTILIIDLFAFDLHSFLLISIVQISLVCNHHNGYGMQNHSSLISGHEKARTHKWMDTRGHHLLLHTDPRGLV